MITLLKCSDRFEEGRTYTKRKGYQSMSIIKSHDITLYGGNERDIILRPLGDEHLPYLYKWNADPEITYFSESSVGLKYDEATVRKKYGGMSDCAFCFIIEVDAVVIGECWLQKMNRHDVLTMYPSGNDVRRIDMCIGEKEYWNRGIGTQFIGMMIDFAFNGEHVDVLHCFCEDYNVRSRRMWEKHRFTL
jgi:Acetyltransferases, including N-acetylases of ribosomal proteins